jgi:hypothetical protein
MPKLGLEIKRKCKFCGKAFIIKTLDSIYCCKKCSEAAYAQKKRAETKEKKLARLFQTRLQRASLSDLYMFRSSSCIFMFHFMLKLNSFLFSC